MTAFISELNRIIKSTDYKKNKNGVFEHVNLKDLDKNIQYLYAELKKNIFDMVKVPMFIAGGYLRKFINKENWLSTDIDIFAKEQSDITSIIEFFKENNCIILKDNRFIFKCKWNDNSIDIIKLSQVSNSPCDTMSTFDFTICCAALDSEGNFYYHKNYFNDLSGRKLVNNYINPGKIINRMQKYIQKGYTMDDTEIGLVCTKIVGYYRRLENAYEDIEDVEKVERDIHPEEVVAPEPSLLARDLYDMNRISSTMIQRALVGHTAETDGVQVPYHLTDAFNYSSNITFQDTSVACVRNNEPF